jgi:hypothetical protein
VTRHVAVLIPAGVLAFDQPGFCAVALLICGTVEPLTRAQEKVNGEVPPVTVVLGEPVDTEPLGAKPLAEPLTLLADTDIALLPRKS